MDNQELQSVLDEMFASEKKFSYEVVRDWQTRYPQYQSEIAEAVANWREFEFLVLEDAETIESVELSDTARNAMEKALAQFRSPPTETITSLTETAEKQGVARDALKKTLGISETLLRKLDRRYIKDIPSWFEEKLADLLRVSQQSIQAFFELSPTLPQAARYKSKNAPQTQPKQSFADAVNTDPQLKKEEKLELLKK